MEFGLSFLPDARPHEKSAADYYSEMLALSRYADKSGYSYIKMTEHYLHPYGGYCPDPLTFLASVASITQKIRLITGCILPVFHNPITIASKTAMVDCISQGRLDVGFARAYLPYEFNAFGISLEENWERFSLTLLATQRLWTEENYSASTPFFQFKNITTLPRCYQNPHPPIWGAAVNSRQSFAWLGENGFNLLATPPLVDWHYWQERLEIYLDAFRSSQPSNKLPKVALSLPLLIDENEAVAEKEGEYYLHGYHSTWLDAIKKGQEFSEGYTDYNRLLHTMEANDAQTMIKNRRAFVGTPDSIIEQIREVQKLNLIDCILWQIDYGAQPYERSLKSLKLFTKYVKPVFDRSTVSAVDCV